MSDAIEYRKTRDLFNWKDNPRAIKKDKFEELKNRITRHGQIKPLIITKQGEVLGGNMRLRAMKELGIDEAWVSVVSPATEAEKIEIALTDNEEMGYYEDQALAELIDKYKDDIDLAKYSVHLSQPKTLAEIIIDIGSDNNLVLDLFLGSGSTLIACEQTNRTCYGMELDPRYVDVIRKRYAKFIDPDNWESNWVDMTPETVKKQ